MDELDPGREERNQKINDLLERLDLHSPGERGHAKRVAIYSVAIGEELGLSDERMLLLRYAAELHDLGKVRVDRSLLEKLGQLSDDEIEEMHAHATRAESALAEHPWLDACRPLIRHHHERWDGAGYPDGLSGEDTPLESRIINLAETFDVLMMREGDAVLIEDLALAEIEHCAGSQFDPKVAEAFFRVQPKIQLLVI
jgi:HD-GYP domain-containing protein (c-di-GMP phosphodiesterase class II)